LIAELADGLRPPHRRGRAQKAPKWLTIVNHPAWHLRPPLSVAAGGTDASGVSKPATKHLNGMLSQSSGPLAAPRRLTGGFDRSLAIDRKVTTTTFRLYDG
jgi:hypothetical protein